MRATSQLLEDNKIRIAVEVDADEVEAAVAKTAKELARTVRIPGFRPGKAPRRVVEARLGGPVALRGEALREMLPDYYARAVSVTEVEPISQPELNVTAGEEDGPVAFDAVVDVRPTVTVTGYGALRVTIPSPLVTDDEVDRLVDKLRDTDAVLEDVSRPIASGDSVTMDVKGSNAEDAQIVDVEDYVYLVGSASIVDTVDDQIVGMRAGETLEAEGLAPGGAPMKVSLALKEVKEKVLPELTDEWVRENSEFDTVDSLRESYLTRIREAKLRTTRSAMRGSLQHELAGQVADADVPEVLLTAEIQERAHEFQHYLERSKLDFGTYQQITGQSVEMVMEMLQDDARHAVKVDLALRAIAAEEGIEPSAEDLDEEIARLAERVGRKPAQLRDELERSGRMGSLRSGKAKELAEALVRERATFVDEEGAEIDRSLLEVADEAGDEDEDGTDGAAEWLEGDVQTKEETT